MPATNDGQFNRCSPLKSENSPTMNSPKVNVAPANPISTAAMMRETGRFTDHSNSRIRQGLFGLIDVR